MELELLDLSCKGTYDSRCGLAATSRMEGDRCRESEEECHQEGAALPVAVPSVPAVSDAIAEAWVELPAEVTDVGEALRNAPPEVVQLAKEVTEADDALTGAGRQRCGVRFIREGPAKSGLPDPGSTLGPVSPLVFSRSKSLN